MNLEKAIYLLGDLSEKYAYNQLLKIYPKKSHCIVDMHYLLELDFGVVNLRTRQFDAIYEIKATVDQEKKEFRAGSKMQLLFADIQNKKRQKGGPYIPFFLYIIRVNRVKWNNGSGTFVVESEEIYNSEECAIDLDKGMWILLK